jgi:hypothetical protein
VTYPYGLSEVLTESDQQSLQAATVDIGHGRTRTAADLIVGWAAHVAKLESQRGLRPSEDRDAWNAHDYVAALIIRDLAERALSILDADLRERAVAALAVSDEVLRSFTEPDERALVRTFAQSDAGTGWWWSRVPRTGLVRRQLEQSIGQGP